MPDTVKAETNLFDVLHSTYQVCDAADVEPISVMSKINFNGAHGISSTQGLIVTMLDGKTYKLTAELLS